MYNLLFSKDFYVIVKEPHPNRFEQETVFYKQEMGVSVPLDRIIGRSENIKKVKSLVMQVAPTDTSVLIIGETGVGKELVAKAVHNLSKRKKGIPLPAVYFIDKYGKKLGKGRGLIPPEELSKLIPYHYPGNVRELEHFVERAVILSDDYRISFSGFEYTSTPQSPAEGPPFVTLSDNEKTYILTVLKTTGWKVSGPGGAAFILGMNLNTLFSRMRKLGIKRPSTKQ